MAVFSFDFDDCIIEFVSHYIAAVNEHSGTCYEVSDLSEFDTSKCADRNGNTATHDSIIKALEHMIHSEVYMDIDIKPEALSVMEYLKDQGHTIIGITQRNMQHLADEPRKKFVYGTQKWAELKLGHVLDELEITGCGITKASVCKKHNVTIHCDDSLQYLSHFIAEKISTVPVLYSQPWNQNSEYHTIHHWTQDIKPHTIYRVDDFIEFRDFIEQKLEFILKLYH